MEKMITAEEEEFLKSARIPIRLAVNTRSGWPMILSLWFKYEDKKLYCATIDTAKVVKYIKNDDRCAFEVAHENPPYKGIRGQGIITLDYSAGGSVLRSLLSKYAVKKDSKLAKFLMSRILNEVALVIQPIRIFSWNYSERMKDAFEI